MTVAEPQARTARSTRLLERLEGAWTAREELLAARSDRYEALLKALLRLYRSSGARGFPRPSDYGTHRIGDLLGVDPRHVTKLLGDARKKKIVGIAPVPVEQIPAAEAEVLRAWEAWQRHRTDQQAALDRVVDLLEAAVGAGLTWQEIADHLGETRERVYRPVQERERAPSRAKTRSNRRVRRPVG